MQSRTQEPGRSPHKKKLEGTVEEIQKETRARGSVRGRPEKKDAFQFDLPQGKIKRRLPDGIVEIDIGYNARSSRV